MTVNPLPTGTMTPVENSGVATDDGIICTGATVVFTAPTGFTNYDFILNGATVQSGASNTYTNSSLATGDKVTVAVTNGSGCIALLNTITITVNPLPVVSPITGGATSVCVNSTTPAFTNTTSGGTGVWSITNGTGTASINAGGVVTGLTPGTVTVNYDFTSTSTGCNTTVSTGLTVNALPTVDPIIGTVNMCTNSTATFTDATPGGIWGSSAPSIASIDAATGVVTTTTNTGPVTISYTTAADANGCTNSTTIDIVVNAFPGLATITPDPADVCVGGTVQLTDVTAGGAWSSLTPGLASVNGSGLVTGIAAGTAMIQYTITPSCGSPLSVMATVNVNDPPSATISYAGGPFCTTSGPVAVNQTGTAGGTYSYTGAGTLALAADGTIDPGASTGGTYTVKYTIAASGGCAVYTTTTTVTITTAPSATISYTGTPYCTTAGTVNVTRTGTAGGTYSSTAGLTLNAVTGAITTGTSSPGTYTVTYTIAAAGGCAQFTTTTTVDITAAPSATISYAGGPFCKTLNNVAVTLTGTTGGTFSAPGALSINSATGAIDPSASTAGTYTVTYTIAAARWMCCI